jgi:short-subunit dehydrogenase
MTKISVTGATVLLTGASSGIGRKLAVELADRGARIAVAARRGALLEQLADEIAGRGRERPAVITADLSRPGAAAALAHDAETALGPVDILVNNAGGGVGGSQWSVGDAAAAREAFETNYWSPLALVSALVPKMRERGRGAVVNVTSMSQLSTWPVFGAYAATKAALALGTETLRLELSGTRVHVLEAIPGPVDTAVQGETRLVPGIDKMLNRVPLGDAAEMARRIVVALERGRTRVIYPRRAAFAYHLPVIARWDTRRLAARVARETDLDVLEAMLSLVVRTGSMGDPAPRAAREAWEAERGRSAAAGLTPPAAARPPTG